MPNVGLSRGKLDKLITLSFQVYCCLYLAVIYVTCQVYSILESISYLESIVDPKRYILKGHTKSTNTETFKIRRAEI